MDSETVHILLVEDDHNHAELVRRGFESRSKDVNLKVVGTLKEARTCLEEIFPDLLIVDLHLPDGEGLELLPVGQEDAHFPVMVMTSHGDEKIAVEAIKSGALDYVVKTNESLAGMAHLAEGALREWQVRKQHKQAEKLQDLQKEVLQKIVGGEPTIDILNALCLQVQKTMPGAICSIMKIEESTGSLHVLAAPNAPENLCTVLDGLIPGEEAASCGTAAYTGEPVFVIDTEVDPRWSRFRDIARQFGIRSCWSFPIVSENQRILGTFAVSHLTPRTPTSFDHKLLETASYAAGITIQKREAEDKLRASEDRFRDLYESAPMAYITSRMSGQIISVNVKAIEILGYSKDELIGKSVVDLYAPTKNGREKAQRLHIQTQEGKEIVAEELEMQRADGSHVWVSLTVRIILDANGIPVERRGIIEDITARKETEEGLRLTKFVIDHAGDSILWAGPDKHILYANEAANRSLGYSPDELIGKPIGAISPSHDPHQFTQKLEHLRHDQMLQYESRHRTKQGKEFPVELTLSMLEHRGAPYTCAIVRDITDRKRAEELLEDQNSILEMISTKTALPDVLTQICKIVEKKSERMYCSIHLLEGKLLRNGAAPNLPDTYIRKLDGVAIGPCAGSCGTAAFRKEPVIVSDIATDPLWEHGRRLALRHGLQACWSTPILSSSGTILGTFAMYYPEPRTPDSESFKLIDIATSLAGIAIEQRRAEDALQKSEDRYRTLYDDNPTMYFTVSTDGTVLSVNQFGAHQLGHTPEELIGKPVVSIFHEEDQPKVLAEFKRSLQNPAQLSSWEFRKVRTDGSLMWVKETTRVVESPNGDPVVLIVCEDITNRKRTEQLQTLQQSTLELMVTGASLSETLDALCTQVEVMVPHAICSILTLDSTEQCLKFQAGPSVPPPLAAALDGMIPGPCAGSCGTATFRKEPVYVSNTATDPLWAHLQDAVKQFNIGSCWSFPIYTERKKILGSFAISSPRPQSPSPIDVQLLETVSYLAGIAIRRKETEQALTESEHRYRTLYEDNPSMYFTVSSDGAVLSVNEFGASQLGYTVQELLGKPASMLFVEEDQVAVKKKLEECLENPEDLAHWQFRKIRKDRRVIWVRETVRVVRNEENQLVFLIVCDDITEQKQADERIAENDRAIRELYEITSSPNRSFEHRVRSLLALGCRRFKLPVGLLTHRLTDELELQFVCSPDPAFKEGLRVPLNHTFCSAAMFAEAPVSFEHASRSEWRHHPGYTKLELESYLGTKVLAGKETYGTFCFTGPEPYTGKFSEADKDFLQLMARWIGTELERLKAETELRENHTLMNAVLEGTTDAFFVKDLEGRYLMMNVAGRGMINKSEHDLIGKTDEEVFPSEIAASIKEQDEKILQSGTTHTFEEELVANGSKHTLLTTKGPYRDAEGQVVGLFGNARDITQRKKVEDQVHEMNLALTNAMPGISQVSSEGRYTHVNDVYAEMLGYNPTDLIGASWDLIIHPDDRKLAKSTYETMLYSGKGEYEARAIRKDGSVFFKQALLVKKVDQNGNYLGYHRFMRDITERKSSEDALRDSEGRLQAILDNSSAVIYVKDLQGKYLLINRKYEKLFKLDMEEIKGKSDFDIFPFEIAKAFTEMDQKVLELGKPLEREEVAPHEDGLHTYISNKFLLRNAHGAPYAVCGISTDINERKQAEKSIRLHTRILESSPNGILITDAQDSKHPIVYCNEAFEKMTGYSQAEILGKNCRFLQGRDTDQDNLSTLRAALATQQSCQVMLRNYKKDGTPFWNDLRLAPVFNEQGKLINYIGVQIDVTERKSVEDALRAIAEAAATLTGVEFIRFLVKTLAICLNVKYAFMTECTDASKQNLRTLAFWNGADFGENFEYNISRTPCEEVMKGEICFLTHNAQKHFPDDQDLKTLEVESYVGYPLFSQSGDIFGHLVAMDTQPLSVNSQAVPIIKLFAARAAAELERNKAETQLRESYKQTRELSARLEAAEESERKRIARELHDEFGQMLTGLKFDLSWVQRRLSEQSSVTPYSTLIGKTRSMSKLTDDLIQTVRRIATSLRPSILDDLGLIPALEWQAKDFQNRTGIQCQFTTEPEITNDYFDNERATALFRIAQELCTNILRYAEASHVNLDLRRENGDIILAVQDNGRGISEHDAKHPTSLGLLGIKERVAPFKGQFHIKGKAGKGTYATVKIPLP